MIIRRMPEISRTLAFLLAFCIVLPVGILLFSVTRSLADTRYVKPSAEVVLRTGQGTEYKIIGLVKDGDVVDLLEEGDSYALVRLADGKEGWMVKRYLSADPPLSTVVASLRAENERMKKKEAEMSRKLEEISTTLKQTETELSATLTERDQIKTEYQTLQQDTADVIQIKKDMQKATRENESLVREMASLKEENHKLNKDKSVNWFIAGAGVLLAGMFLGRLISKSRRRKSSLI